MIEQGYNDYLMSSREMSSFELNVQVAKTEAEIMKVLEDYDLTEKDFPDGNVPGLPPDEPLCHSEEEQKSQVMAL